MRNSNFSDDNLAILDPYKAIFKMSAAQHTTQVTVVYVVTVGCEKLFVILDWRSFIPVI